MTLCPIALAVGCRKCPIFAVCPVKGVIGDYKKEDPAPAKAEAARPATGAKAQCEGRREVGVESAAERAIGRNS